MTFNTFLLAFWLLFDIFYSNSIVLYDFNNNLPFNTLRPAILCLVSWEETFLGVVCLLIMLIIPILLNVFATLAYFKNSRWSYPIYVLFMLDIILNLTVKHFIAIISCILLMICVKYFRKKTGEGSVVSK